MILNPEDQTSYGTCPQNVCCIPNMFGDIGLISGRALHQIGNGVYMSRRSRMAKTATLIQGQSSSKCENKMSQVTTVPSYIQIGVIREDTWVLT